MLYGGHVYPDTFAQSSNQLHSRNGGYPQTQYDFVSIAYRRRPIIKDPSADVGYSVLRTCVVALDWKASMRSLCIWNRRMLCT